VWEDATRETAFGQVISTVAQDGSLNLSQFGNAPYGFYGAMQGLTRGVMWIVKPITPAAIRGCESGYLLTV
jgi:hypothetical protein